MGRASGREKPASDKEEGCCRMGLQLGGKRRDPISGISRQWEQPTSLFYQEKASLPPLFLSAAVRLSCGMEWVCLWMRHCVAGYTTFMPEACSQVCGSRMETNIFIYAHTKTHWLWFHLEDPESREHFPPKAASTVVLLFSWTLILSVLYIHLSTPLLNNWIYFISLGRWKETQSGKSFQPYSAETQSSLCYCCGDISQQWLYYYPGYESRSNFSLCQLQFAYFAMSSFQATPTIVKISNDATLDWHTKLSNINLKF